MKSKNVRTLLSLAIMNMIVVLNIPGQIFKLGPPPMQPTQPTPTKPMPVILAPVQPGEPGSSGINHPSAFTNRPYMNTNRPLVFNSHMV